MRMSCNRSNCRKRKRVWQIPKEGKFELRIENLQIFPKQECRWRGSNPRSPDKWSEVKWKRIEREGCSVLELSQPLNGSHHFNQAPRAVTIFVIATNSRLNWSVYIHQSSRPSAWLTYTRNGARLSTILFLIMGHSKPLFYLSLFCILIVHLVDKILLMRGFEQWISGAGINCFTNWATSIGKFTRLTTPSFRLWIFTTLGVSYSKQQIQRFSHAILETPEAPSVDKNSQNFI